MASALFSFEPFERPKGIEPFEPFYILGILLPSPLGEGLGVRLPILPILLILHHREVRLIAALCDVMVFQRL